MTVPVASASASSTSNAPPPTVAATSTSPRLWVRYESGIEEQVELARISPEHDVQAHAKGAAK